MIEDPTNRYALPLSIRFTGGRPIDPIEGLLLDDGVEAVEVIGVSRVDVKPAVAASRAAAVGKLVRARVLQSVRVTERITGASRVIVDDEIGARPDADVVVIVTRARAVEIWKWQDDHLVRATPRARLPVPTLPPGC